MRSLDVAAHARKHVPPTDREDFLVRTRMTSTASTNEDPRMLWYLVTSFDASEV
jgi:hypothetical protein